MAINKVINKNTKSHGAMRNVLEYVLRDEKIKQGYVDITGPYAADKINYNDVYRTWLEEKRLWGKDFGRMYAHNIISFHKDEAITPEKVLEIGREFCDKFFPNHQCVIGVHQDKDHLHCHIVINSVSYIDGLKLHQTQRDLDRQKDYTNHLCLENGLSIAEKGHHFDGTAIEEGHVTAWSKDKYNLLANESKRSFVADCAIAVMEAIPLSASRDEFMAEMERRGWTLNWEENRKHIVFQNQSGDKVRDSNLEKTFSMEISKETLTHEFERQAEARLGQSGHDTAEQRAEEFELSIGATSTDRGTIKDPEDDNLTAGLPSEERAQDGSGTDTAALLRELNAQESFARKERSDREAKRERQRVEAERRASEEKRTTEEGSRRRRQQSHSRGIER